MSSTPSPARKADLTGWEAEEVEGGTAEERQEQRASNTFSMNSVSSAEVGSRLR